MTWRGWYLGLASNLPLAVLVSHYAHADWLLAATITALVTLLGSAVGAFTSHRIARRALNIDHDTEVRDMTAIRRTQLLHRQSNDGGAAIAGIAWAFAAIGWVLYALGVDGAINMAVGCTLAALIATAFAVWA